MTTTPIGICPICDDMAALAAHPDEPTLLWCAECITFDLNAAPDPIILDLVTNHPELLEER
jgi:hypothetical protein